MNFYKCICIYMDYTCMFVVLQIKHCYLQILLNGNKMYSSSQNLVYVVDLFDNIYKTIKSSNFYVLLVLKNIIKLLLVKSPTIL